MPRRLVPLPRFRWPIVLLVIGLGLVIVAIFATERAIYSNRILTRRALNGYAGFASWSYHQHLSEALRSTVREVLGPVNHGDELHTSIGYPSAKGLVHNIHWDNKCLCHRPRIGPNPNAVFGFTLGGDTLGVAINQYESPTVGWTVDEPPSTGQMVHVMPMNPATRRWLVDTLTSLARGPRSPWGFGVLVAADSISAQMYAYTLMPRSAGDTIVYGVAYSTAAIDSLFGAVLDEQGLLPEALVNGLSRTSRDIIGLKLTSSSGRVLFDYRGVGEHSFRSQMPPSYGGIRIQAFVQPGSASRMLIGSYPASSLPFLIVLLGLATALTAVAVAQLRRESQFAELRADFVGNVSHELRTPLTQIRLVLDTLRLRDNVGDGGRERAMALADREVARLQNLVESVLHFTRGPQATDATPTLPVDVGTEVQQIVDDFQALAASRNVTVQLQVENTPQVALRAGVLRQVVLNLLDNAVKYGPKGQTVRIAVSAPGATRVRIAVADNGPGIPEGERTRIWRAFERGSAATKGAVSGSGIGLTVVHELVEAHGGSVDIQPNESGGAVFIVEFPAAQETGKAQPGRST